MKKNQEIFKLTFIDKLFLHTLYRYLQLFIYLCITLCERIFNASIYYIKIIVSVYISQNLFLDYETECDGINRSHESEDVIITLRIFRNLN